MSNASKWLAALALVCSLGVTGAMAQSTGGNGSGASGGDGGSAGAASGSSGGPSGGGGGGAPFHPIIPGSPDSGACAVLPDLPDPGLFSDVGDAVKAASRATTAYIERCGCTTQACIADALESYAATLEKAGPRLPPQLRDLPKLVASAAHRVRAARTKGDAVKILLTTVAHIQKEILLIRVENPDQPNREHRSGDFVSGTLQTAAAALERSDAL